MTPDTQKQKAITAIRVLIETCQSAKHSISNHPQSLDVESPPLSALRSDLLALCSFLHGLVTKLSLALKPSSPTYSACLAPLKELSERIAALSHCINMFNGSVHGATLTKESVSVVIEVITSVQALATTFLEIEDSGERSTSGDYLVRTGAIHALIEMARSNDGLPKDNLAAVRRHWLKDAGALEDGVREVGEMIEDARNEIETDEDDGWDELGIEPSQPLTEEELKRTKKVLSVLRLCNLLHQKVITEILSTSSSTWANSVLDELAPLSPALLSACDELVSTLDSPQEADSVKTELDALRGVIDRIRDRLSLLYNHPDSTALLDGVSLNQTIPTNRRNPMEKWFNTCFDQILKAIQLAAGPSNVGTES